MPRILTFSSLYPNGAQPTHGVFVEERLRHLLETGAVAAEVIAPVPWFPLRGRRFGRYGEFAGVPSEERRLGLRIHHPRYLAIPKVGMRPSVWLMEQGCWSAMQKVVASSRAQLIDAHYLFPDGVAASRLAARVKLPYVLTARGSDVNLIGEIPWCRQLMLHAIAGASATVTVSEALKQRLVSWGARAEHITVVRNGVDFAKFDPARYRDSPPARPAGRPALLSIGKLDENKGHHLLIDALCELPEASLTIVGQGPMRSVLAKQIEARGLSHRAQLIGPISHDQLARYYTAADIVVLASAREGLPNVLLEALACGTPVVATRVGGIPEVIDRPELGLLVESRTAPALGAAIRAVAARPFDRDQVRSLAARFDWRVSSQRLAELLGGVAAQGDGVGGLRHVSARTASL